MVSGSSGIDHGQVRGGIQSAHSMRCTSQYLAPSVLSSDVVVKDSRICVRFYASEALAAIQPPQSGDTFKIGMLDYLVAMSRIFVKLGSRN